MPLIHAGDGGAKGGIGGLTGGLAAESGAASIFRRRRRAVSRGFPLEHTPMRFALRESTRQNFAEMPVVESASVAIAIASAQPQQWCG